MTIQTVHPADTPVLIAALAGEHVRASEFHNPVDRTAYLAGISTVRDLIAHDGVPETASNLICYLIARPVGPLDAEDRGMVDAMLLAFGR